MKHFISLVIAFAVIFLSLSGCYIYSYVPVGNYTLKSINTPEGNDVSVVANTYYDDIVTLGASMTSENIELQIANKASSSIKVLWDDGAYIDEYGNAHRIIHTGTNFIDKEKAQVPSVIPKGTQISDIIAPSDYVEYNSATGSWKYTSLASQGVSYESEEAARASFKKFQPVRLLIPIEHDGATKEYTLTFEGKDYDVETKQTYNASGILLAAICGISGAVTLASALIIYAYYL